MTQSLNPGTGVEQVEQGADALERHGSVAAGPELVIAGIGPVKLDGYKLHDVGFRGVNVEAAQKAIAAHYGLAVSEQEHAVLVAEAAIKDAFLASRQQEKK